MKKQIKQLKEEKIDLEKQLKAVDKVRDNLILCDRAKKKVIDHLLHDRLNFAVSMIKGEKDKKKLKQIKEEIEDTRDLVFEIWASDMYFKKTNLFEEYVKAKTNNPIFKKIKGIEVCKTFSFNSKNEFFY